MLPKQLSENLESSQFEHPHLEHQMENYVRILQTKVQKERCAKRMCLIKTSPDKKQITQFLKKPNFIKLKLIFYLSQPPKMLRLSYSTVFPREALAGRALRRVKHLPQARLSRFCFWQEHFYIFKGIHSKLKSASWKTGLWLSLIL